MVVAHSFVADADVTVEYAFTADGQLGSLTAENAVTVDQTTGYVHKTAGGNAPSAVCRIGLTRAEIGSDSDDTESLEKVRPPRPYSPRPSDHRGQRRRWCRAADQYGV